MQDQFPQLDAPEHHPDNVVRPVVPEPSLRVIKEVHVEVSSSITGQAYLREGWIKAGTAALGEVLEEAVPLILLKGEALIHTGEAVQHVQAPFVCVNQPGVRRALYAVTDCYLLNALFTQDETVAEVEARVVPNRKESLCGWQQQSPSLE